MGTYQKIEAAGGKMPRKLKKQIKKMPIGSYCYGSAIGDKGKIVNGKRKWETIFCPNFHGMKNPSKDGESQCYCSFLNKADDFLLADQVKICGDYAGFFPEFKKHKGLSSEEYMKIYKPKEWVWMQEKPEGMGMIRWLFEFEKKQERERKETLKEQKLQKQHNREIRSLLKR